MGGGEGYAERERRGARNFARMASREGIERVIYLGGLGDDDASAHLRSRHETARVLAAAGPPLTYFRAAMVVGAESESYRTLRYLVGRLPVMIAPAWLKTPTQPIGIDAVIEYLRRAPEVPESGGREVQIGGPDVLTYAEMLDRMATAMGKRHRPKLPVPLVTPWLSALWLGLITPVDTKVARPLVEGLDHGDGGERSLRCRAVRDLPRTIRRDAGPGVGGGKGGLSCAVVLFTRDLRVRDQAALAAAVREAERVVPMFVLDNALLRGPCGAPNRLSFLLDCLHDLDGSLRERGARLVLRRGDPVEEALRVAGECGAGAIHLSDDYSAYARRRHERLERWLRSGLAGYEEGRDRLAVDGTSHLSADLHFGCLSPSVVLDRVAGRPGAGVFIRQLCWRDFHHQVLSARPDLPRVDYRGRGDRWRRSKGLAEAWRRGRTGYPIVELETIDGPVVHEPWLLDAALRRRLDYPDPVVNHEEGAVQFRRFRESGPG